METLKVLGATLESGVPLPEAVSFTAKVCPWAPFKAGLSFLGESLQNGVSPSDAVKSPLCSKLPPWLLAILSASLEEKEKGILIISHPDVTLVKSYYPAIPFILVQLIVQVFIFYSLIAYVIPVLKEVFFEVGVPISHFSQGIFLFSDFFNKWKYFFIVIVTLALYFLFKILWDVQIKVEEEGRETVHVLRSLSGVQQSRYPHILSAFTLPELLPVTHGSFSKIFRLGSNADQQAFSPNSLSPLVNWAISLGLQGCGSSKMFRQVSELIETRLFFSLKRKTIFFENLFLIGNASFVGIIAISVFSLLLSLLDLSMK